MRKTKTVTVFLLAMLLCMTTVLGSNIGTITAQAASTLDFNIIEVTGTYGDNEWDNAYSTWSSVMNSYIYEYNGKTVTVEYVSGKGVVVDTYSSSYTRESEKIISPELSLFGGFYSGTTYNYLVYGQTNSDEDDYSEVLRIVKYTKSWTRVSACSIYGANTYIPFDAGSLRMTETGGYLYVYTCHEMYESSDGYHHQANMTYKINVSSMSVTSSYYGIMNISYGYVSHSFNQFIATDGDYIYRVDHGDAYPRSVSLTKTKVSSSVTSVSGYENLYSISGSTGNNYTGVSVGGLALSDDNCLVVGNSTDQTEFSSSTYSYSAKRNIFLVVADKDMTSTETIWLTSYSSSGNIQTYTPQIVEVNSDLFLIMWEEYNSSTKTYSTKMMTVDADGNTVSKAVSTDLVLSDCQPIISSDGYVKWFVSDGSSKIIYRVNPKDLSVTDKSAMPFTDIETGTWKIQVAQYNYINGYILGTSDTTFSPSANMTRGQLVTILYRIEGYPSVKFSSPYTDVSSGKYYSSAVQWAKNVGIINGYGDGTFGPTDPIKRQDFVIILRNYAKYKGYNVTISGSSYEACTDYTKVSSYAVASIEWAYERNFIGKTGTLSPTSNITRIDAAAIIKSFMEYYD